jgi:quercetin dioxygenase-like cupin family protein
MHGLRTKNRKWAAAMFGTAVIAAIVAAVAYANAGSGMSAETLVTANFDTTFQLNNDRVKFQTKDANDLRVQKATFTAGATSGWHHHPGMVLATVASGSVTVWDENCNQETYGPGLPNGAVFVEGGNDPMQVTSTGGATEYVTLVAPDHTPPLFRLEDEPPPCAS